MMAGAMMGHDNEVGDFCHIAAQSAVGSYLKIGKGVHIGLNATIREFLTIGDYATLGAGAVLTKDLPSNEIWIGNPAKFLRYAR
jgi:acetyltransferase EpsM